ncbi:MAG: hypothetical protein ABIH23_30620, partial [bacterium]
LSLLNLLGEKIRLFSLRASLQHGVYALPNLGEGNLLPKIGGDAEGVEFMAFGTSSILCSEY